MPVFFSPTRIQDQLDFASVPGAGNDGYALTWDDGAAAFVLAEAGVTDHSALTGLADDDHTQYALLAGRATPQTLAFGSASGATAGYLTSTSHATKGRYALNAAGTIIVDEANGRLKVGPTFINSADGVINIGGTLGSSGSEFMFAAGVSWVIARSGVLRFLADNTHVVTVSGGGVVLTALIPHATHKGIVVQGFTSQSAPLVQLQGISSTSTVRERANIDAIAVDNTDATRKYALVLSPWDTAAREAMRLWADGSAGRVAITAPASAPTDAHLANGQISAYLDESGHNLIFRVRYSDGTMKTATIALT